MPAKNTPANATDALNALLDAAEMMLSARADDMLTDEEWDGLATAVAKGRQVLPRIPTEPDEMLATLKVAKTDRRYAGTGTWATGTIAGHDFCALVFPVHALNRDWELGDSRISKLSLTEQGRSTRVAAFDRGWDLRPTTDIAKRIVDLLSAGLAETVFGK